MGGDPKRQWPIRVNKGIRKPAATEAVLASYPVGKGPLSNLLPSMTAVLYGCFFSRLVIGSFLFFLYPLLALCVRFFYSIRISVASGEEGGIALNSLKSGKSILKVWSFSVNWKLYNCSSSRNRSVGPSSSSRVLVLALRSVH